MPTYAGYQSREGKDHVNFTEAFQKLGEQVKGAVNTRKREREAFDTQAAETNAIVENIEVNSDQSLQDAVLTWADSARDQIYDWSVAAKNGEITQSEFKQRMNQISDAWTSTANFTKTFDERNQRALERQQANAEGIIEGSSMEGYINQSMSEYGYIGDYDMEWGDSGIGVLVKRDEEGNIVNSMNAGRLNQPGNMMDIPRFNITTETKTFTDTWKEWMTYETGRRGSSVSITDVRENPEYIRGREAAVRAMMSSPNKIVGVLTDNGAMSPAYYEDNDGDGEPDGVSYVGNAGYQFYRTDMEFESKVDEKVSQLKQEAGFLSEDFNEAEVRSEVESMMIRMSVNDRTGVYQPDLTEEQIKAAEAASRSTIEMQLGHKVTGKTERAPTTTTTTGGGKPTTEESADDLMHTVYEAWTSGDNDALSALDALTGDDMFFKWVPGGLQAYINPKQKLNMQTGIMETVGTESGKPMGSILEMSSIFMGETDGSGQGEAHSEWKAAYKRLKKSLGGNGSNEGVGSKYNNEG